jgi:hypothetical protein
VAEKLRTFRALANWLLGEDDHHLPALPEGLPDDFARALEQHVRMLVEFQNSEYAALYLDRLGRFHARHGVGAELFAEIADLLARRMSFNDPIRVAQIVLGRAEFATSTIDPPNGLYRPEYEEFIAMFPRDQAELITDGLTAVKMLRGRMRIRLGRTIDRLRLKLFLLFRRIRRTSLRYAKENSSIERWLHMIDRALNKQPSATLEVVRSIRIVSGYGTDYRLALADWNLIINSLAKPVFDGDLVLPNLAEAMARAREAATAEPGGEQLRRTIADIRAQAAAAASGAA